MCSGDSGGPMCVMNSENEPVCQYGISSAGEDKLGISNKCTGRSYFSSVVYYYDWIQMHLEMHLDSPPLSPQR